MLDLRLQNKIILITGGARGLGFAMAMQFLLQGAKVIVLDKNSHEIASFREKHIAYIQTYIKNNAAIDIDITKTLKNISCMLCDLSDEKAIKATFAKISENYSKINCLVNNAALIKMYGIEACEQDWQESLLNNVANYALVTKYSLALLERGEDANIINIGSVSAFIAQEKFLTYSTCKSAIINMTKCMALDFSHLNIRVNAVHPGTIWTEYTADFVKQNYAIDKLTADKHQDFGKKTLVNKIGSVEDVSSFVLFLSSYHANYMNGQNIIIDGGHSINLR